MSTKKAGFFFFVGTEAELIKVFPVILDIQSRGISYYLIASGQNDLSNSMIIKHALKRLPDLALSQEADIKKTGGGLLRWFISTRRGAVKTIRKAFPHVDFSRSIFVIHGDTVSTVMGAGIGKKLGTKVAHVEAGMRSHHFFNPFPEEIDRILASRKAYIHFAPGKEASDNLAGKEHVIDTQQNTLLDSLTFSYTVPNSNKTLDLLANTKYFVFVVHRQENLANTSFLKELVRQVLKQTEYFHCVLILHKLTEIKLKEANLMSGFENNDNVTISPRVEYFDFMKLLERSEFVITDGGSNQQELYYMGKPCLIIRQRTESKEGVGMNARLYGGDLASISQFASSYEQFRHPHVTMGLDGPSKIVGSALQKLMGELEFS